VSPSSSRTPKEALIPKEPSNHQAHHKNCHEDRKLSTMAHKHYCGVMCTVMSREVRLSGEVGRRVSTSERVCFAKTIAERFCTIDGVRPTSSKSSAENSFRRLLEVSKSEFFIRSPSSATNPQPRITTFYALNTGINTTGSPFDTITITIVACTHRRART